MTNDDEVFLRKMLADLHVFPAITISNADMARCIRNLIIQALDTSNQKRAPAIRQSRAISLDEESG